MTNYFVILSNKNNLNQFVTALYLITFVASFESESIGARFICAHQYSATRREYQSSLIIWSEAICWRQFVTR